MTTSPATEPPPFLEDAPPAWAARSLSTVLIALFIVGLVALFVVAGTARTEETAALDAAP